MPAEAAYILDGRLVVSGELEGNVTFNEQLLKDLAGSARISVRNLYEKYHKRTPRCLVVLMGNYLPELMSNSKALQRRLVVVPWERVFSEEEQNPGLKKEILAAEAPQILQWLIDGAVAYFSEGISIPEEWRQTTSDFFSETDIVGRFLSECVEQVRGAVVARPLLYQEFNRFCRSEGIRQPPSATVFNRDLKKRGFADRKSGVMMWDGLRLRALGYR